MDDRPTTRELLTAVEHFLDRDLVSELKGRHQFLARVAANALRMVTREIETAGDRAERSRQGLDEILGPSEAAEAERVGELASRIRSGEFDAPELRAKLLVFLRSEVADKLSVSNPGLLAADRERGIG